MNECRMLGYRTQVATTSYARMRGLIGRPRLAPDEALLIPHCNCIHTFFMRYAIDARFLDASGNVVKTVRNIRPWRLFVWGGWKARQVLETASATGAESARASFRGDPRG